MKDYGTFDILGPIMVGPSSSHTAGAARLGKLGLDIAGTGFNNVCFYLHGSFGKTYEGHGTDKALLAGILGMYPDDEDLKNSFEIAKEKKISFQFVETDLGYHHPNTVKILFDYPDRESVYIIGSSIGGGKVKIVDVNGTKVDFSGEYPTIIIKYSDKKGVISKISSTMSLNDLNIATMKVTRDEDIATMITELDSAFDNVLIDQIKALEDVNYVIGVNPV